MVKKLFKALKIILVSLALGLSFSCQNQVQMNPKMHGGFSYADTHKITYYNVDGLKNENPEQFYDLDTVELVPVRKNGYVFDGWYTTSSFTAESRITGWGAFEQTGDVAIYAKYITIEVTLDKRVVIFKGTGEVPVEVSATVSGIDNPVFEWSSSNESVAKVQNGVITAVSTGYASVKLDVGGMARYVFVIVMPDYANTTYDSGTVTASNGYYTDATNVVSYSFRNGTLDFQGRLSSSSGWAYTTFGSYGWYWNVNGSDVYFQNGNNTVSTGNLDLTVIPVLAYDSATNTSFVVIYQLLTNTGTTKLTGQKMASHADIELGWNDSAPIMPKSYGARMYDPSTKLAFDMYCCSGDDCTPVDTLWYGGYWERFNHLWDGTIRDTPLTNTDSGMCYSWMNIDIEPGETVLKSIRMTLVEYDPNNP